MKIALTGATGFIGRYIAAHLARQGHGLRCWCRSTSDRSGFGPPADKIDWIEGELGHNEDARRFVQGCDAVVHSALYHPGGGWRAEDGEILDFIEKNVVGTLQLIEAAKAAGVRRFVLISTCAVHDKILEDRPLDEAHPLWPASHYGAHKAALEKFVHSYGLGHGFPICALRPTGVYGLAHPPEKSKWFDLVSAVVRGESVHCTQGGKEVHAADVAKAVGVLLAADEAAIRGEAFSCYDRYVSAYDIATIAKQQSGSASEILGGQTTPKHQIATGKIRALGMEFGGDDLLRRTIAELVQSVQD